MGHVKGFVLALALGLGLMSDRTASAAMVYSFVEQGGDVVGTLSGDLDLTGLNDITGSSGAALIRPSTGYLLSYSSFSTSKAFLVSGPDSFGSGGPTFASATTGTRVLILPTVYFGSDIFHVESAYVSGAPMTGSIVFANQTYASLGITPGDYTWTFENGDTFTLSFATAVPAPGALPLMAGALAMLGLARRRRSA
jgi:hypothetical protein